MSNVKTAFGSKLPESYEGLVAIYIPRPLHDDIDYSNACEVMSAIAVVDEGDLNQDQFDYLEILSQMIEMYDNKDEEIDTAQYRGINALLELCKLHEISGAELSRILGLSESVGGKILRKEYEISKSNMKKLGKHFCVSPTLFMDA